MHVQSHPHRSPAQVVLLVIAAVAAAVNILLPRPLAHPVNLVLLAVLAGVAVVLVHRRLTASRRR
ncbi:MAG TPA: hypothetical protein VFS29_02315 [Motilibacteraceae bacterium]|nr:hypothetical protein [Motilibacteraceae bacterium]